MKLNTKTIMTKPARKPNSDAPGVKLLITAASLAATLGGWALISSVEAKPAPTPASAPEQTAAPVVTIKLAPLPTLVPPVTPQPRLVTINQPRPAARAPQPAVSTELVLRDVSAPALPDRSAPAPVANTRSSR
jgi:hypothetical protein